jgi:hypothetical protein
MAPPLVRAAILAPRLPRTLTAMGAAMLEAPEGTLLLLLREPEAD